MTPFVFGRDYRPDMMHDEANTWSQMDRLATALLFKTYPVDSITQHMVEALKEIQADKTMSNEECGHAFAALLTSPAPQMQDDYDDEYDMEDYGPEEQHNYGNQKSSFTPYANNHTKNPLQNERLKIGYQRGGGGGAS